MKRPRWLSVIAFGALFVFWIAAIRAFLLVAHEDPLWLDELHTQWLVSGSWSDVFSRSLRWNQTPLYFFLEHSVVHALPDVLGRERLVSIVSIVATGVFLATFIGNRTGNWLAAAFASISFGMVRQVPFYATEARPYALLMFATVLQVAWLIDFLYPPSKPTENHAEKKQATGLKAAVGLLLGCALVAIHPTALLIVVAEIFLLTLWIFGTRKSGGREVPFGTCLVVLAMAVASGVIWLIVLERTWMQRQLWQGMAEPFQLGVWFLWLLVWTAVPAIFLRARWRKESNSSALVSIAPACLALAIPAFVVALLLIVDTAQIFPLANIRYAVAALPVMFLSIGLFLDRQSTTVTIICGHLVLLGLAFIPTPSWSSNRLAWSNERNWMVDAFLGNVGQLRFEHWNDVDAILGKEIGSGPAVVFLMANVLEDSHLNVSNSSSASSPPDDFQFPVASFRSRQLNVEILPRSTLIGPRFSPADLARLSQPEAKHFLVLRGTDATFKTIQNEIEIALKAEKRSVIFNLLGPPLSNVRVWQIIPHQR